ncbi:MAG: ATP-binding cassette domain-containing protein, partial [Ruminococcus sp.]|nr:ATP-binding cassette domain-containing protein [Ruminococcus sp.]
CVVTCENGGCFIADNGSLNGVILNGSPLSGRVKLADGDRITIADTSVIFSGETLYLSVFTEGVSVVAAGIVKRVKASGGRKVIADNVSLSVNPGEFAAIIGGSGAGKTTLLNCLSGLAGFDSGDVLINGESIRSNAKSLRSIIGYVPQKDIVYDGLTLERMLYYSAKLRMPADTSPEEIRRKIDETLEMVELSAHRKTHIGKLSGGQKKRASIAVELLASPKLFFLDEPSSGLDPGTEKHLMELLKKLADSGKTVIMVTHTVQNIQLCDRLICMGSGGKLCYCGSPLTAASFFGKENLTDIYTELNENSRENARRFSEVSLYENTPSSLTFPRDISRQKKRRRKGLGLRQFLYMTARYGELMINSPGRLLMLGIMPAALTLTVCLAFQADGDIYKLLDISVERTSMPFMKAWDTISLLFSFSCAAFWTGIFNSVQEISKERVIFLREQRAGAGTLAYVMSKFTVQAVLCAVQSAVMTAVFMRLTDTTVTAANAPAEDSLHLKMNSDGIIFTDGGMWAEHYLTTFLTVICAMAVGLAVSAAASNEMAMVVCPLCLLPQILFSGVVTELSGITKIISNTITCRWACIGYFTSSDVNSLYARCVYENGSWAMTAYAGGYGVDEAYSPEKSFLFGFDPVISSWIALGIMTAVCIILAMIFIGLRNKKASCGGK